MACRQRGQVLPHARQGRQGKGRSLSAAVVGTTIDRAIQDARLDVVDAPPAFAEDLAAIALLCGADAGQLDAILGSEASASGDDKAP